MITDTRIFRHGLYRVHWKDGSVSLASVGSLADGTRWISPTNWIHVPQDPKAIKEAWDLVEVLEPIVLT